VASDTRDVTLLAAPKPEYYFCTLQALARPLDFLVRTSGDPAALAPDIRKQVWAVLRDQPITNLQTMDRSISIAVGQPRLRSILLGVFAGIGVLLAVLGVYGVVAYSVARRRQEIGIRMALGARPSSILRMVLKQGLVLGGLGVFLGGIAAIGLARVALKEFYGIRPIEPIAYLGAAVTILLVAALACFIPARRAMRLDPVTALRHE
jgi:putative ABC transport system permease protein